MSTHAAGAAPAAASAAVLAAVASPYLAALTSTVADRANRRWWRPAAHASAHRVGVTAGVGVAYAVLAGIAAGWDAMLPAFIALALFAAPLAVIDVEHHRLPNRLVYPSALTAAVLLSVAAAVTGNWPALLRAAMSAAATFVVLGVLWLIAPTSFGRGDARLGGIVAAYLGWFGWLPVFYGIFAGFACGAVVAIGLMTVRRAGRKTRLPFGPMLLAGPLVVLAFHLYPAAVG